MQAYEKKINFYNYKTDGWTTEDLVFQWKQTDPVQVARNMHLPRFILEKFQTDLCNSITNTGKFTTKLVLSARSNFVKWMPPSLN